MKFVDNDHLAGLILEYIMACDYIYESEINLENVVDWLKLSSGVNSIAIDTTKYDHSLTYCGHALDYENARSKLMSSLTTELVRFHFVWGALESLVAEFVPQADVERFGKINALCDYLKKSCLEGLLPKGYREGYSRFVELMREISQYKNDLDAINITRSKQSKKRHIDIAGIGVYSVYKVRNKFAHGSMEFPEPDGYGEGAEFNKELIIFATRIVLMTIIMLFISDIKNNNAAMTLDNFRFIKSFKFDSYEYSLTSQLDEPGFDVHKVTAVRYLQHLCLDKA